MERLSRLSWIAYSFLSFELAAERSFVVLPSAKEALPVSPYVPERTFVERLSTLALGLKTLDMGDIKFRDSALVALSGSQAAGSLQSLKITKLRLTAASAGCWLKFPVLKSLEIGYFDHQIEQEQLQEICKSQTLKRLSVYLSDVEHLALLLAADSLPKLKRLSSDSSERCQPKKILDLLLARQNNQRLQELDVNLDTSSPSFCRVAFRLHQLCPRLRTLLAPSLSSPIAIDLEQCVAKAAEGEEVPLKSLRNLASLDTSWFTLGDPNLSLQSWATIFPRAERLTIGAEADKNPPPANPLSFDLFGSLTALELRFSGSERPQFVNFPPLLQSFGLDVLHDPSVEQIDQLLDTLLVCAPGLSRLSLRYHGLSLQRSHLEKCVTSFSKLTSLKLSNLFRDRAAVEDFPLSHPFLKDVSDRDFTVRGVRRVVPLWLPNWRSLDVSDMYFGSEVTQHLSAFPNLSTVYLDGIDMVPNDAIRKLAETACADSSTPRISSLRFSVHWGWRNGNLRLEYDAFCAMVSLRKLQFDKEVPFPEKTIQRLLQRLTRLSHLEAAVTLESNDISWLCHQKIDEILLDIQCKNKEKHCHLILTPATLPALRLAVIETPILTAVTVSNLPDLERLTLSLAEKTTIAAPLTIRGCSRLEEIHLLYCAYDRLEFSNLPLLNCVVFHRCTVWKKAPLQLENCGRLARVIVDMIEGQEELWQNIASRMKPFLPAGCILDPR